MNQPNETDAMLAALLQGVDEALPAASKLRRAIHANPRLSGDEADTASRLRRALRGDGEFTKTAETGFAVRLGPAGPAVAIRAELDALPIQEETGITWAATNGAMHACGHDVHMAALWALLQAAKNVDLPVGLLAVFQPREESHPSGAKDVVASTLFTDHKVGAMIGAHVQPRVPFGVISTGVGGVNAAADEFEITIHGYGGHGGYPHITIDPVPIMASVVNGLHELVGRNIDPTHPALITTGQVWAGTAPNVIPATAHIRGVIRTTDEEDRLRLHSDIRRLAQHSASARRADASVEITMGYPVLANDGALVKAVDPLIEAAGYPVAPEPFRSLGADDFAHYALVVPILMMFVGTGRGPSPDGRHEVGLHHAKYLPGEASIKHVAASLAAGYLGASRVVVSGN